MPPRIAGAKILRGTPVKFIYIGGVETFEVRLGKDDIRSFRNG
jgi:hypothetical protein